MAEGTNDNGYLRALTSELMTLKDHAGFEPATSLLAGEVTAIYAIHAIESGNKH